MKLGGKITVHLLLDVPSREAGEARLKQLVDELVNAYKPIVENISIDMVGKRTLKSAKRPVTFYSSRDYVQIRHCFINVNRLKVADVILFYNLETEEQVIYQKLGDTWSMYSQSDYKFIGYKDDTKVLQEIQNSNSHIGSFRCVTLDHFTTKEIQNIFEKLDLRLPCKIIGLPKGRLDLVKFTKE